MVTQVRFIADAMLGKLAKWLRILGCDVAYDPDISDRKIAEQTLATLRPLAKVALVETDPALRGYSSPAPHAASRNPLLRTLARES